MGGQSSKNQKKNFVPPQRAPSENSPTASVPSRGTRTEYASDASIEQIGARPCVEPVGVRKPSIFDTKGTDTASSKCANWDEVDVLASQTQVEKYIARNFVKLIKEGNTLPFIARYRKAVVGNLRPEELLDLYEKYQSLVEIKKKTKSVLETLKKTKKITPEIEETIMNVKSLSELDLVYAPLKSEKITLAQKARNLGLEGPAIQLLNQESVNIFQLCNPSNEEIATPDKVEKHMVHIMADIVYKDHRVISQMMKLKEETNFTLVTARTQSSMKPMDETQKQQSRNNPETYKLYFQFRRQIKQLESYQVLAINRAEDEKILSVKVEIPDWFMNQLEKFCRMIWKSHVYLHKALMDGYVRMVKPWLVRQVRSQLTVEARKQGYKRFAENLQTYLLTEPVKNKIIAGLDPGFRAGLKVGIIDCNGRMLHICTIKPNFKNQTYDSAANELRQKLTSFRVELIGLGNGTACRETENWLRQHRISLEIPVIIVPESGASVYSVSKEAIQEHPNMDPNHISALSIARRVMDPLGELIKVDPKSLGVGMYQHDMPEKMLDSAVNMTVENIVSLHGADLNTASYALLKRISGLKENQVNNILEYRAKNGRFNTRAELRNVPGIGKITYDQCAGFLKVTKGPEPLDSTIIHPESYKIARVFAQKLSLDLSKIAEPSFAQLAETKMANLVISSMVKILNTDEGCLSVIMSAFKNVSHEDITYQKPVYSICVQKMDSLRPGMIITGVVRNVTDFGCFVDIGVGQDGLIHKSKFCGHQTPKLNDRVSVKVLPEHQENKISLGLVEILS